MADYVAFIVLGFAHYPFNGLMVVPYVVVVILSVGRTDTETEDPILKILKASSLSIVREVREPM